ncbi:hypothetical protein TcYC6_0022220 [Trypanosoma cruzi]|nr:hypothetical protein TcYC6_0022220 [Trypanosoma cruzi]
MGPVPGADRIHEEALRHLGRVAERAVPGCPKDDCTQEPSRGIGDVEPSHPSSIRGKRIQGAIGSQSTLQTSGCWPVDFILDPLLRLRAARAAMPHNTAQRLSLWNATRPSTRWTMKASFWERGDCRSVMERNAGQQRSSIAKALWFASTNLHLPPRSPYEARRKEQCCVPSCPSSS